MDPTVRMRTLLAAVGLLAFATSPEAQVRKGLVEIGGSVSLSITEDFAFLALSPTVGYFITNRIEAGSTLDSRPTSRAAKVDP